MDLREHRKDLSLKTGIPAEELEKSARKALLHKPTDPQPEDIFRNRISRYILKIRPPHDQADSDDR